MSERNFTEMLKKRWEKNHFVCVGLDSEYEKIPAAAKKSSVEETIFYFNQCIIDATKDVVCAYKPNIAFYEGYGMEGLSALIRTADYLHKSAPEIPIILDAKRADIGNTNRGYVKATFEILKMDAVTVHPYLGGEALQPFLDQKDKGVIVLCRTSNPGAKELQDIIVDGEPVYRVVAKRVANEWNKNGNCCVVVGATYPDELKEVRKIIGDMPILIPGIGAQGGDVEKTVKAGCDSKKQGMIINSSRGIIFASKEKDFAEVARKQTLQLDQEINQYR